jgi:hypothetical protein
MAAHVGISNAKATANFAAAFAAAGALGFYD